VGKIGFVTDSLSSAAQELMLVCFRQKLSAAMTAAKIKAETGEDVAERTIGRRKSEWEANEKRRKSAREQMQDLLDAMRGGNHTASEMVNALAIESLMRDPEGFIDSDPIRMQRTSLLAEQVRLKRDQLDLKKREVALNEAKFDLLKRQKDQAIAEVEALEKKAAAGESISTEGLKKIRDIYGIGQ
jgi:hypothetical protein